MIEVRDHNSNAILFKRSEREKKVDILEETVNTLKEELENMKKLIQSSKVE